MMKRLACPLTIMDLLAIWLGLLTAGAQAAPRCGDDWLTEPVFDSRMHVTQAGCPHAETVLLLHGIGENAARDWSRLIPALARRYHVIAPDLPGFGRSTQGNEAYTLPNYDAVVMFLLDRHARGGGPVHVVGHSLGGTLALYLAARHPDRVNRLIVASAPGILHPRVYSRHFVGGKLDNLFPFFDRGPNQALAGAVSDTLGFLERIGPDREKVLHDPGLRKRYFGGTPSRIVAYATASEDMSGAITSVRASTLVLWGERDPVAPPRTAQVLVAMLPDAQLKWMAHAGHTLMEEDAVWFEREVLAFLGQSGTGQAGLRASAADAAVPEVTGTRRIGRCHHEHNVYFEGAYARIEITGCKNVSLRKARVDALVVNDASVEIVSSVVGVISGGGDRAAIRCNDARLRITASRVMGDPAIESVGCKLDLAGVRLKSPGQAITSPGDFSRVVISVSEVEAAAGKRGLHGEFTLEAGRGL